MPSVPRTPPRAPDDAVSPELRDLVDELGALQNHLRLYVELCDFLELQGLAEAPRSLQDQLLLGWLDDEVATLRPLRRGRDLIDNFHDLLLDHLERLVHDLDRWGFRRELETRWQLTARTHLREAIFPVDAPPAVVRRWPANGHRGTATRRRPRR